MTKTVLISSINRNYGMNTRTELGKIESAYFGIGGYQDAQIGLHVSLQGSGWGVCDSNCAWDAETIQWSEHCKWSEDERDARYTRIVRYISKLLKDAKVDSVDKLKGVPVEVTFDGMTLKSWRILAEVL
jgi:hypothetical protein